MSNGMRRVIVSIAEIVSSMFSSFKSRIPENVEPHRRRQRDVGYWFLVYVLAVWIVDKNWPVWSRAPNNQQLKHDPLRTSRLGPDNPNLKTVPHPLVMPRICVLFLLVALTL
jgi:hypothetical protein